MCSPTANAISGSVNGTAVSTVGSALWIENPGAPDQATTRVVYVFDSAIKCADIQAAGWDTKIPAGTKILEIKVWGTTPQSFKVTTSQTPAAGESSCPFTVAGPGATDQAAASGTVTVAALTAATTATGCFAIGYPTGSLAGTFQAQWCAGGVEP